jgi:hypothetical protein
MESNKEVKPQTEKEIVSGKETELTEKQLEKAVGGLKAAPTLVDADDFLVKPALKAPPL